MDIPGIAPGHPEGYYKEIRRLAEDTRYRFKSVVEGGPKFLRFAMNDPKGDFSAMQCYYADCTQPYCLLVWFWQDHTLVHRHINGLVALADYLLALRAERFELLQELEELGVIVRRVDGFTSFE